MKEILKRYGRPVLMIGAKGESPAYLFSALQEMPGPGLGFQVG
jgi:hypothetical protein